MEDKILNRVKKMMAIAECSGATEAERDTALKMAYKILAAHNLSMVDLDAHVANQSDPRAMHDQVGYGMPWAKEIYHAIAGLFFCKYFGGKKINAWKITVHFVGRESNATTAMHMSQFIIESLIKESRKRYKEDSCPEARSFALGAASKLRERIRIIKQDQQKAEQSEVKGRDLVLANLYEVEASANALVLKDNGITLRPANQGKKTVRGNAYEDGKEFGAGIGLSLQVGATNRNLKRIGG